MDTKKETAMMLGRFQPFHKGHKELFKAALRRTGQVIILVRDTGGKDPKNPYTYREVKERIQKELAEYRGCFMVAKVPNITHICYGRKVGYQIEKISLPKDIEAISATKIRKKM